MGKSLNKAENTKKAAGNAKKAEAAARKREAEDAKVAAAEDAAWAKGSKNSSKKDEAEAKKLEAARKKAERDAQLAEEEKGARAAPKASKTAQKKSGGGGAAAPKRGLDLSALDDNDDNATASGSKSGPEATGAGAALNASGIDSAIDALSIATGGPAEKIDRHPERRFKAAYAAFEARRLPEIERERPGLRLQQRKDACRKEFDKSPDNPFNQATASYDTTKAEVKELQRGERQKMEDLLTEK